MRPSAPSNADSSMTLRQGVEVNVVAPTREQAAGIAHLIRHEVIRYEASLPPAANEDVEPQSMRTKLINHPWTVAIGGGLLVALILYLITTL